MERRLTKRSLVDSLNKDLVSRSLTETHHKDLHEGNLRGSLAQELPQLSLQRDLAQPLLQRSCQGDLAHDLLLFTKGTCRSIPWYFFIAFLATPCKISCCGNRCELLRFLTRMACKAKVLLVLQEFLDASWSYSKLQGLHHRIQLCVLSVL